MISLILGPFSFTYYHNYLVFDKAISVKMYNGFILLSAVSCIIIELALIPFVLFMGDFLWH